MAFSSGILGSGAKGLRNRPPFASYVVQCRPWISGNPAAQVIGNIQTADFVNPAGLQAIGNNLLVETQASGAPLVGGAGEEGRGSLRGGMLEGSNVNVVEELVDMIETQRAYEVNSKMISATDEMMKNAAQTL